MISQDPGATVSVIVGVTLAILLVNVGLAVYAWTRRPAAEYDGAVDERTRSDGAPTVACPDCGAKNDPEYRYCRACVSELPGYAANRTRSRRRSAGSVGETTVTTHSTSRTTNRSVVSNM